MAKTILKAGGVAFGAAMQPDFSVRHIRVENVDNVSALQGSKYIQFRTLDTYQQVRTALHQGRQVLYTGTPCQITGLKEACYTCPYAQRQRVSDITMGDFWELQDEELKKKAQFGVSVMMVNTEKGQRLCDMAGGLLELTERSTDEAVAGNKQLRHPMPRHRNYKRYKRLNKKWSFQSAAICSLLPERLAYAVLNKVK